MSDTFKVSDTLLSKCICSLFLHRLLCVFRRLTNVVSFEPRRRALRATKNFRYSIRSADFSAIKTNRKNPCLKAVSSVFFLCETSCLRVFVVLFCASRSQRILCKCLTLLKCQTPHFSEAACSMILFRRCTHSATGIFVLLFVARL